MRNPEPKVSYQDEESPAWKAPTEATVLGAVMLLGRKALPVEVSSLSVECFTQSVYAYIWLKIEACLYEVTDCDEGTVWHRIKADNDAPDGIAYAFHCLAATCPSTVNLDHWAKQLIEAAELTRQERRLSEIVADTRMDSETKAAEVQRTLLGVRSKAGGIKRVSELLVPWMKEFEQSKTDPDAGIVAKTGIPSIDNMTKLKAGEMTIIAGRPGMGKSALAGCVAAYCAKRNAGDVAMFSLEMTSTAIIGRLVTSVGRVDLGRNKSDMKWDRVAHAVSEIKPMALYIDDRSNLSVSDMRAALMRVPKVSLIVVDYLGLLATDKKAQRHDLAVGWNTKEVRALAKDFGAHAIVLCQLNRKVEERNPPMPMLSDLRDSGNIEEDADNVWLIYRPGYYERRKNPNSQDKFASIMVAKQRHGETGNIDISWEGSTQRFFETETRQEFAR